MAVAVVVVFVFFTFADGIAAFLEIGIVGGLELESLDEDVEGGGAKLDRLVMLLLVVTAFDMLPLEDNELGDVVDFMTLALRDAPFDEDFVVEQRSLVLVEMFKDQSALRILH